MSTQAEVITLIWVQHPSNTSRWLPAQCVASSGRGMRDDCGVSAPAARAGLHFPQPGSSSHPPLYCANPCQAPRAGQSLSPGNEKQRSGAVQTPPGITGEPRACTAEESSTQKSGERGLVVRMTVPAEICRGEWTRKEGQRTRMSYPAKESTNLTQWWH